MTENQKNADSLSKMSQKNYLNSGANRDQESDESKSPTGGVYLNQRGKNVSKSSKLDQDKLVKGPWSAEEDAVLWEWVRNNGPKKWSACAQSIIGRSGKQCRERWMNSLNPDVKKGEWTPEEQYKILEGFKSEGCSWSSIARKIENRTENSIKNYFYSTVRKFHSGKMAHLMAQFAAGIERNECELPNEVIDKFSNNLNALGLNFLRFLSENNTPSRFLQAKQDLLALLTTKPKVQGNLGNLTKRSHKESRSALKNEEAETEEEDESMESQEDEESGQYEKEPKNAGHPRLVIDMLKKESTVMEEEKANEIQASESPNKVVKPVPQRLCSDQGNEKNYMVKSMNKNQKVEMLNMLKNHTRKQKEPASGQESSIKDEEKEQNSPSVEVVQKKKRKYTKKKKFDTDFLKMLSFVPSHNEQASSWSLTHNKSGYEYPLFVLPKQIGLESSGDGSGGDHADKVETGSRVFYPLPKGMELHPGFSFPSSLVPGELLCSGDHGTQPQSKGGFLNSGLIGNKKREGANGQLDVHVGREEPSREMKVDKVGDFLADLFSGFKINTLTLSQCPTCLNNSVSSPNNGFVKRGQGQEPSSCVCTHTHGQGPVLPALPGGPHNDSAYRDVVFSMLNELKKYLAQGQRMMYGNGLGFPPKNGALDLSRPEKLETSDRSGQSQCSKTEVNMEDQIEKIAKIKDILIQQAPPSPVQVENLLFKKLMEIEQLVLSSEGMKP